MYTWMQIHTYSQCNRDLDTAFQTGKVNIKTEHAKYCDEIKYVKK